MIALGQFNTLKILSQTSTHWLLDGGDSGEIRLSKRDAPRDWRVADEVTVFVYTGEDGYLAASTRTPLAKVNEVASLTVLEASRDGIWLDLGLEEAVFMPRAEQQQRLEPGWRSMVMMTVDERLGLIASARLNDFLDDEATDLAAGEKVELVVALRTDLGFKAVVNNRYWGMLYGDEVFEPLRIGDRDRLARVGRGGLSHLGERGGDVGGPVDPLEHGLLIEGAGDRAAYFEDAFALPSGSEHDRHAAHPT